MDNTAITLPLFFLYFFLSLKAQWTQFPGIPPYGDSLGSTSRTPTVLKALDFLYYQVYKEQDLTLKGTG